MNEELTIDSISLPKNWKMLPFGDVCEISGGSQPPKSTFIYEPKEGYIRLVQVRDYRTEKFITYIPKERAKKFCSKTDIMIGRYGPPIFGIFRGIAGAYNVALMKAIPNKELLDQEYLYWFLKTDTLVKFVEKSSKRAAGQDGVRKEVLYTYPTPIPPLNQQKLLVDIIIKAFAAIDKAKANAEQNLQNAKELFESYLQNVFENKGDDWEEKTLKDVTSKIGSGATPRGGKASYKEEGISLIRSMNVHDFHFKKKNLAFIDDKQADTLSNVTLQEKDVLLNITGASIARCCMVPKEYLPARVNQHVSIIRAKKEIINPVFLASLLTSKYFKDQILEIGEQGATRQAITEVQLENFNISFPKEIEEQEKVVQNINLIKAEIKKLEVIYTQKIADLEEMKKSVLQKAFSGQLNTKN
jgi:type I restriction enzyme S subunit